MYLAFTFLVILLEKLQMLQPSRHQWLGHISMSICYFLGTEAVLAVNINVCLCFWIFWHLLLKFMLIPFTSCMCFTWVLNEQEISQRRFIREVSWQLKRCHQHRCRFGGHHISLYNGCRGWFKILRRTESFWVLLHCPLFTESATGWELNAIKSGHLCSLFLLLQCFSWEPNQQEAYSKTDENRQQGASALVALNEFLENHKLPAMPWDDDDQRPALNQDIKREIPSAPNAINLLLPLVTTGIYWR